jgi:hypothetical protein
MQTPPFQSGNSGNSIDLIWASVKVLEPTLSYATFMGMTGGAWRTCLCSPACEHLYLDEIDRTLDAGLERIGLRRELKEGEQPPYRLRRSRSPMGLRSRRELTALTEGLAELLRPPFPGICPELVPITYQGCGLAAYTLWADSLSSAPVQNDNSFNRKRLEQWADAHRAGREFLLELAGKKRTFFANRLRRTGELFQQEVSDCFEPLLSKTAPITQGELVTALHNAQDLAEDAAHILAEGLLPTLGLSPLVVTALMEEPGDSLDGMGLQELLYLARAGSRPLKQLAARRLAGARQRNATSTLGQLIYNPDSAVRETAMWSLRKIDPPHLLNILGGALRSDMPEAQDLAYRHLRLMDLPEAAKLVEEHETLTRDP